MENIDIEKNESHEDIDLINKDDTEIIVEDKIEEEIIISKEGQSAIKSWFMVCKYSKLLAICYGGMTLMIVLLAFASIGTHEEWFWPKIYFLIIISAAMLFISGVIRAMVHSGSGVPQLRADLTTTDDDEKIVTANNFYIMITKTLLIPSTTMALAVISLKDVMLNSVAVKNSDSVTPLFGFVFTGLLIVAIVLLIRLYLYLASVRKINKALSEEVSRRYKEQSEQVNQEQQA